ncbi:HWE histidine kinase domain-containing protein [Rhizobium sp. Root1334]|uniref:HWE histidine kinase domain-containing protein n=1 Tax=unclassified Rhizobium TaxID=2613769 RepID=UPI0009E6F1D4
MSLGLSESRNGEDGFAFLGNGGEMGALIRDRDWALTPLGPVSEWPGCLKTATSLLLQSPVPIVMLWGEQGVMIYNDAYSVFAGKRHPHLLGSNVREGWAEVADFNDNVMKVGLAGGTLAYRDQELTLHRKGYPEQVWMDLDYSPVLDESGKPAGVIAIVVETTERVLADRRNAAEHERLQQLFEQAPSFMAMLQGSQHRFELVNPEYRKLIGERDVLGKPVGEALPEITSQGFVELLDKVFETGQAVNRTAEKVLLQKPGEGVEERYLDFVYQPIKNDDGDVTHIFVQGSDVTLRVRAENHQRLLVNELNHRVKNTLASVQSIATQTLRGANSVEEASGAISARILALSAAHNILTNENWDGADLAVIVTSSLEAFDGLDGNRFRIRGPHVRLGPRAALSMSLALHELATNAVKYGALSNEAGFVTIDWSVIRKADSSAFTLRWCETGGPPMPASDRKGFGSRLILRVLPMELGGTAQVNYGPDGLIFTLETTMQAIEESVPGD